MLNTESMYTPKPHTKGGIEMITEPMYTPKQRTKEFYYLLDLSLRYEGKTLEEIYEKVSQPKRDRYESLCDKFFSDLTADGFGICAHSRAGFVVSWFSDDGIHLEQIHRTVLLPWEYITPQDVRNADKRKGTKHY